MVGIALVISGARPYDRATWLMEVAPVLVAVPILWATARRFPLTPLAYRLLVLHALVLILGGAYSYARVPLGDWLRDFVGGTRNNYDRLGHFMQGFVPAIVVRELLRRHTPLRRGAWLFTLVTFVCLGISAAYELVEWLAATLGGAAANDFLGTQGDVWDTQWDMLMALVGAIAAQFLFSAEHERELHELGVT